MFINGKWRVDNGATPTRQFIFEHHSPIPGLPFVVIPDAEARRIVASFNIGEGLRSCWSRGRSKSYPTLAFKRSDGSMDRLKGNRFALMLVDDTPIPHGKLANHCCGNRWCVNPLHVYCGTYSENNRDTYLNGRQPGRRAVCEAEDNIQILADRAERAGRTIRCQRFFPDAIFKESHHGSALHHLHASAPSRDQGIPQRWSDVGSVGIGIRRHRERVVPALVQSEVRSSLGGR